MAVCAVWGLSFLVVFLTRCRPLSQMWDPVLGGTCRKLQVEQFACGTTNLIIDIFIVILPMPVLWRLKMPIRQKFIVSIMFSIGIMLVHLASSLNVFTTN